jgi:hypothetical protein
VPFDVHVDKERRLVTATARGVITPAEVFAYQQDVWSRPDVAGFDELVDMTRAEKIEFPSSASIRQLASLSATMDTSGAPTRFAIVAPEALAFGLARMYETYRSLEANSNKEVAVFHTLEQALLFLGRPNETKKAV